MTGGTAHLDDVVAAILHHLRPRSPRFTANREEIHRAFFKLKGEFPEELALLSFRQKGFFPESLGLDQALSNLEASRLLHRQNAAPLLYDIDPDIEDCYNRFVKPRLRDRGLAPSRTEEIATRLAEELLDPATS